MADGQQQLVLSESHDLNAIIVEILSRLPAKSLVRFRCVSKAWRDLISESYFIKNHLTHIDTKNILNWKLLLSTSPAQAIDYAALSNIASSNEEDDDPVASREVDYPVNTRHFCLKVLVGSCNGLVCLLLDVNVVLWNPCTRVIQSLPSPTRFNRSCEFYGFGYDSATDDCKIVVGSYRPLAGSGHGYHLQHGEGFEETMIEVFALKTGSWRTLERLDFVMLFGQGCVVNGALHWLKHQPSEHGLIVSKIMCFDLGEEKFREFAVPCPPNYVGRNYFSVGIGAIRNCLTAYFEPRDGFDYRMWVMKEYGVKESWAEIIRIPFEVLPQDYEICLQPLFIFENDEVLMNINGDVLALYNQKEKTFRNVFKTPVENAWRQTTTYVETLVSPLIGGAPNLSNQHCESFAIFV
ncbi:F-box/kelch-repeat protein [Rosa sericea]